MNASPPPPRPLIEQWSNAEGDQFMRTGDFYSFTTADGFRGIKLWIPPTGQPVRGVIFHGNPGGGFGGDTRDKTTQRDILEFAAREGLGIAGVSGFPGREIYQNLGLVILRAFKGWAEHGGHPELANVPLLMTGGSNAGMTSFAMLCNSPERIIAITPNCGPIYNLPITDAVRKVPAWMHVGTTDPLIPVGVENTEALFLEQGKYDLPWAWDAEIKGHENGSSDNADMAYWEAIVRVRVPAAGPEFIPGKLNPVDMKSGWYVDHRSWDHTITRVLPASELPNPTAEPGRYGWMPDEGMARIYQSVATRARHILLSYAEDMKIQSGPTSGVFLASGANRIYSPGDTVKIKVEFTPMMWGIKEADIYDRDEKLGTIDFTKGNTFEIKVDGSHTIYALHVRALATRFKIDRVSTPLLFVVRDPKLSTKIDQQFDLVALDNRVQAQASKNTDTKAIAGPVLEKSALTPVLFAAQPIDTLPTPNPFAKGTIQPFWKKLQARIPALEINQICKSEDPHQIIPEEQKASDLPKAVHAQAAYNKAGLYFLFTVEGANWDQPTNDDLQQTIDFHLASQSLDSLQKGNTAELFAWPPATSLLRNALQMQLSMLSTNRVPQSFHLNDWSMWDCVSHTITMNEPDSKTGIWTNLVNVDANHRALEVFLPWHMAGYPGLAAVPPAGSRMAMIIGYNAITNKMVWPHGTNPWITPRTKLQSADEVWGELILMP